MNINMQLLENMTEQERFDWFEGIGARAAGAA